MITKEITLINLIEIAISKESISTDIKSIELDDDDMQLTLKTWSNHVFTIDVKMIK